MTDIAENLLGKKSTLDFYYKKAQDAFKAKNVSRALKISNDGLEKAELENDSNWIEKFDTFNEHLNQMNKFSVQNETLTPSTIKEDLTVVKGIGKSVAEKLGRSGITSVEDLVKYNSSSLAQFKGIGPSTAQKLIDAAKSHLSVKKLNHFSQVMDEDKELSPEIHQAEVENKNIISIDDTTESFYQNDGEQEVCKGNVHEEEDFENYHDFIENNTSNSDDIHAKPIFNSEFKEEMVYIREKEDPESLDLISKQSGDHGEKNSEKLNYTEIKTFLKAVRNSIESNGFFIIEKSPNLRDIHLGLDLLAVKVIRSNELLDLIYIMPIKLSLLKGSLVISAGEIDYNPKERITGGIIYQNYARSYIKILKNAYCKISNDLLNEGDLTVFFRNYLKINITIEKTVMNKRLSYHSGPRELKVLIEPILVCQNKVGFIEKLIPFAYQKKNNIHVTDITKISSLIRYLEKKYLLIESHVENESSIVSKNESVNKLLKYLIVSSCPFLIYGTIFMILLVLQGYSFLRQFINLGYSASMIYLILVGYLYVRYLKKKSEIKRGFETPHFQRNLQFDDTNLVLINEELTPILMEQFTYECLDNDPGFKVIEKIERENAQEFLTNKLLVKKAKNGEFFETPSSTGSVLPKNIVDKYSSFLED